MTMTMTKDLTIKPFDFFKKGIIAGLHYCIIQHPEMGHLNGYVRLPSTSKMFKQAHVVRPRFKYGERTSKKRTAVRRGYDTHEIANLPAHGGITYAGTLHPHALRHPLRGYWIGFDCAHLGDLAPGNPFLATHDGTFRDVAFVMEQITALAEHISQAAQHTPNFTRS